MRRWRRTGSGKGGFRGPFFAAIVLCGAVLFGLNAMLHPIVENVVINEAKRASVMDMNKAVLQELNQKNISYAELVHVERSENGQILAITTDMVRMNELKSSVLTDIQNEMDNAGHTDVGIPLGTLLGNDLLHGRGPEIPVRLTLSGNVTADFESSFESAGINQTRHQISLKIHTSVYSFLPGFRDTVEVETSVPVAETVIVGEVPSFMANLQQTQP